jgi:hypothetical protein
MHDMGKSKCKSPCILQEFEELQAAITESIGVTMEKIDKAIAVPDK